MSARSTKSLEILIEDDQSHPDTIPEESDTISTLTLVESEGKGFYMHQIMSISNLQALLMTIICSNRGNYKTKIYFELVLKKTFGTFP